MNNLKTPEDWNREVLQNPAKVREYIFEKWGEDIEKLSPQDIDGTELDVFIDNIVLYILSYQIHREDFQTDAKQRLELRGGIRSQDRYIKKITPHIKALRGMASNNLYEADILNHLKALSGLFSYGISPMNISIRTKEDVEEFIKMEIRGTGNRASELKNEISELELKIFRLDEKKRYGKDEKELEKIKEEIEVLAKKKSKLEGIKSEIETKITREIAKKIKSFIKTL